MNKKQKIAAFTLNELIVVMVITVIVVGMVYSVLSLVQSHMKSIEHNLENTTEVNLIEQALTIDFNTYNNVTVHKSKAVVFKNDLDSIVYHFENDLLIRQTDTFDIVIGNAEFFINKQNVTTGQIDAIRIGINPQKRENTIFIYQQNDAQTYMN